MHQRDASCMCTGTYGATYPGYRSDVGGPWLAIRVRRFSVKIMVRRAGAGCTFCAQFLSSANARLFRLSWRKWKYSCRTGD